MVFKKLLKGKKESEPDVAAKSEASPVAEEQVGLGHSLERLAFAVAHALLRAPMTPPFAQVTYHADADESGGMLCTNDELLRLQQQ